MMSYQGISLREVTSLMSTVTSPRKFNTRPRQCYEFDKYGLLFFVRSRELEHRMSENVYSCCIERMNLRGVSSLLLVTVPAWIFPFNTGLKLSILSRVEVPHHVGLASCGHGVSKRNITNPVRR